MGAREIGFTVVSMSVSLIAVFIPILLMGGLVGRLFREFAVTLSVAVAVSMVVSLTTTPMMCAHLLAAEDGAAHGRLYRSSERAFEGLLRALRPQPDVDAAALAAHAARLRSRPIAVNVALYIAIPKGFFPQQDTGMLGGDRAGAAGHRRITRSPRCSRDFVAHRFRRIRRSTASSAFTGGGGDGRELGPHVHRAQAAGGGRSIRGRGDRASAAAVRQRAEGQRCSSRPSRTSASAAERRTRSTSSRSRPTISTT